MDLHIFSSGVSIYLVMNESHKEYFELYKKKEGNQIHFFHLSFLSALSRYRSIMAYGNTK